MSTTKCNRRLNRLLKLANRDGWGCHYCGILLVPDIDHRGDQFWSQYGLRAATFEHLLPRALGGTYQADNLVLSCQKCNGNRPDNPQSVWHHKDPNSEPILNWRGEEYVMREGKWVKKVSQ